MGIADDIRALIDKHCLSRVIARVHKLEHHMSQVDDAVAELNAATNDVADDLERLRTEVTGLDSATADKLTPLVERLRALAADPENPVPA